MRLFVATFVRISRGVAVLFLAGLLGGCPLLYKLFDDDGKTSSGTVSVTTTSPSGELTWTIDEDTGVTFSIEPSLRTGKCTSAGDGTTYGLCFATYYCVLYKSSSDTVAKKQYATLMFDNANGKWRFVASMEQVATCF